MLDSIRKYKITLVLSLLLFSTAYSQKLEVGVLGGGSYYYGDIVNDWDPKSIYYSFGAILRYHLNENFVLKGYGGYCKIGGADSNSKTSEYQRNRNLAFWADVYEGSIQIEYSFVKDITRGRRLRNRIIPYVFGGVGMIYWKNWAYFPNPGGVGFPQQLYSLGTEGKLYNNYAVCVPFGVGVKYKVTSNLYVGLEFGVRYTTTTYLDDVGGLGAKYPDKTTLMISVPYPDAALIMTDRSPGQWFSQPEMGNLRGKVAINDFYFVYGLTLSYRFGTSGGGGGGYKGKAIRCPRFY